jgi:transposase
MTPLYVGIDWSERKHDVAVVNDAGLVVARLTLAHSQEGFGKLTALCQKLQVTPKQVCVSIETKHNLLVDYLWSYGFSQVYIVAPSLVKGYRQRYTNSGAHTDTTDAQMLADILRTDRQRLTLWRPDRPLTRELRATVSEVHQLTQQAVMLSNQLRATLLRYYPGVLDVFPDLMRLTPVAWVIQYPRPTTLAALTFEAFKTFLQAQHYPRPQHALALWPALQQPALVTDAATEQVHAHVAQTTATLLLQVLQLRGEAQKRLTRLFGQHPDHAIFASLPGAGPILAPALLAKFGDDRQRFPSAASVQALAGTCPVTEQSGKHRRIHYRRACDNEFRTIAQQWAMASVRGNKSLFATAYWENLRGRNMTNSHAYRCLANRWLAVAWRLWQAHTCYDEAKHLRQRNERSLARATQAVQSRPAQSAGAPA